MSLVTTSHPHLDKWFAADEQLHQLYPTSIQMLANRHWTPLLVARLAIPFLVTGPGVTILDIGSGVGKFCLAGGYYQPSASFYGVEQRKDLTLHAQAACSFLGLQHVHFIHGNFTQLNLKQYHHFYFYNSFHENLAGTDKIDDSIDYSVELYNYYSHYLYKQLNEMSAGTRIASYCSWDDEIPPGYQLAETHLDRLLKCWIKT